MILRQIDVFPAPEGAETTIFVNLDDEGDRQFAVQLGTVAGVLAIMMSEDGGGDETA